MAKTYRAVEETGEDPEFDFIRQRIKRRSTYLALAVFLILFLVLMLFIFLSVNNIIELQISVKLIIDGFLLSVLAGIVIGFVYYVTSAWMLL